MFNEFQAEINKIQADGAKYNERYKIPIFALARKLHNKLNDVAPKLGKAKFQELEQILRDIETEANNPRCQRCGEKMLAQSYQEKITWWSCNSCADEQDSEPPRIR